MDTKFLTNPTEVLAFCSANNIKTFMNMVFPDGSIIADSDVDLSKKGYISLPIKFAGCFGNFDISNNLLTTLEGVPNKVSKHFNCSNNKLTNLNFFPTEVSSCNVKGNSGKFLIKNVLNTGCYVLGGVNAIEADGNTLSDIHAICAKYGIKNYIVNPDLSINVNGNVYIQFCNLQELPLEFNTVTGNFDCHGNYLTSLEGAPSSVGGYFDCSRNKLTSLKGSPSSVGRDFECSNNLLTSLKYAPSMIDREFNCGGNNLTSLEHAPWYVDGNFYCLSNKNTLSLQGSPSSVGGNFSCMYSNVSSLQGGPQVVIGSFLCNNNSIYSLNGSPIYVGEIYNIRFNPGYFSPETVKSVCHVGGAVYSDYGIGKNDKNNEEIEEVLPNFEDIKLKYEYEVELEMNKEMQKPEMTFEEFKIFHSERIKKWEDGYEVSEN